MINIVICGTPGTGKSTIVEKLLLKLSNFKAVNLSHLAVENHCTEGYDDELETHIIDEEKLDKVLVPILKANEYSIIESIHSDMMPTHIVSLVFVCRTETNRLYNRLASRNYSAIKIDNNIQAEIFQSILDEAKETYDESKVIELFNNDLSDLDTNTDIILNATKDLMGIKRASNFSA